VLTGLDRVFELGLWAIRPWLCQPILAPVFLGLPELIRGEVCSHWQGRRGLNLPFHGVCIRVILLCWAQIHPQKIPCNSKACVATCTHPVLCCHPALCCHPVLCCISVSRQLTVSAQKPAQQNDMQQQGVRHTLKAQSLFRVPLQFIDGNSMTVGIQIGILRRLLCTAVAV
jgi:hypothetical protein